MKRDIEFAANGTTLRGWLVTPEESSGPAPTIVMAHGFSAVKEMYLDAFAQVFADAGMNALVFDQRNFGASDGSPRQEIDPRTPPTNGPTAMPSPSALSASSVAILGIGQSGQLYRSLDAGHVPLQAALEQRAGGGERIAIEIAALDSRGGQVHKRFAVTKPACRFALAGELQRLARAAIGAGHWQDFACTEMLKCQGKSHRPVVVFLIDLFGKTISALFGHVHVSGPKLKLHGARPALNRQLGQVVSQRQQSHVAVLFRRRALKI